MQSIPQASQRKVAHVEPSDSVAEVMKCTLPPHRVPALFSSYDDYEVHYKQFHVNRCSECGRNFPSELFLNLHIEENHDPLMDEKRKRGEKTFGCFVEGCEKRCSTFHKRKLHLIDKHMFPRKYNFSIVDHGIDRHSSLLKPGSTITQPRRISLSTPTSPTTATAPTAPDSATHSRRRKLSQVINGSPESPKPVSAPFSAERERKLGRNSNNEPHGSSSQGPEGGRDDMADLEKSMSALRFVPTSVSLRQQRTRTEK